ncbi:hypothetical protein ACXR0O_24440 [Verrucomicrobiota bacterium sgz303538]
MSLSIHPVVLMALMAVIVGVALVILAFRASRADHRNALLVAGLVCFVPAAYLFVLTHPEFVDARFRAYKTFYNGIREGMTREEVFALLDLRYPPDGPRQRPKVMADEPGNLGFFMSPETSREPNCEGIFLTLHDSHVVKKYYSAD